MQHIKIKWQTCVVIFCLTSFKEAYKYRIETLEKGMQNNLYKKRTQLLTLKFIIPFNTRKEKPIEIQIIEFIFFYLFNFHGLDFWNFEFLIQLKHITQLAQPKCFFLAVFCINTN